MPPLRGWLSAIRQFVHDVTVALNGPDYPANGVQHRPADDLIRDRLRNGHRVTTRRKLAHLVPLLCIGAQIAIIELNLRPRFLGPDGRWLCLAVPALLAAAGSFYAGVRASRWWFVITILELVLVLFAAEMFG